MIPKIAKRGARTVGLLAYLYGPGIRDQHTDPHLVAAWDQAVPDPVRDSDVTLAQLARHLDQPVRALPAHRRPGRHVWHASVRAAPEDRELSDAEWGQIAHRMVAATGIAPAGDLDACRWAAIRHAGDHIHIVATLVREDGRRPRLQADAARAQAECRSIEVEFGLRRLHAGDGTAARRPTSAERAKAERHGRPRTPREHLREAVRQALVGATAPEEFFQRLADHGLLVRQRIAPSGDVTGYTVALPGDRTAGGTPVWFSGSTLAPDLSWPRIHRRLNNTDTDASTSPVNDRGTPPAARHQAAAAAWDAASTLTRGDDDPRAAAELAAASEVLDALAATSARPTRAQIRAAATAFERASRCHIRAAHAHSHALRRAARALIYAGPVLGRGRDGTAAATLLASLVLLVLAAQSWHAARDHHQQAAAAQLAAEHLRAAYGITARRPLTALREHGLGLPQHVRDRHAATLRAVYPEGAEQLLTERGWPALAATLDQAEHAGADIAALLRQAIETRELDSAQFLSDVLVWRLHHLANLSTEPDTHDLDNARHPPPPTSPAKRDPQPLPPGDPRR